MDKRKDHLDSSGAGSQGQKSPGKAQEEDLSSPEAPSHLEVQASTISSAWSFTGESLQVLTRRNCVRKVLFH